MRETSSPGPKRTRVHRWLGGAAVAALLVSAQVADRADLPADTARPRPPARANVVLIAVDDMRNDDLRFMPRTRRLIRDQGVRFANAFSPLPHCCPARASWLTGLYAHNHGVLGVRPPYGFSAFDDRSTLATWLQSDGYWTGYLGKYMNGYGSAPPYLGESRRSLRYVPPGWTSWRASLDGGLPRDHPRWGSTYHFTDTTLSVDGSRLRGFADLYQTRVYGRLAVRTLHRRAGAPQPFLFVLSFTAPHNGMPVEPDDALPPSRFGDETFHTTARPRWTWGMYDDRITAAPGADWSDDDFGDKPDFLRGAPPLASPEKAALLEVTRQRAEALAVVDRQVRRVMWTLRDEGLLSQTYVLFTSDNGYLLGEQRLRQGKIFPYEPSLRVPLLLRGPGITGGGTRRDPFTSVDLAPTLADMAGTPPAHVVDGTSMLDVALRGDQGWLRPVLTETGPMFGESRDTDLAGGPLEPGEQADPRFIIGVRTARYLYTDIATGERELYDLRRDPRQYRNLAQVSGHANTLSDLARVLDWLRACRGAECREPLPPSFQD